MCLVCNKPGSTLECVRCAFVGVSLPATSRSNNERYLEYRVCPECAESLDKAPPLTADCEYCKFTGRMVHPLIEVIEDWNGYNLCEVCVKEEKQGKRHPLVMPCDSCGQWASVTGERLYGRDYEGDISRNVCCSCAAEKGKARGVSTASLISIRPIRR